MNNSYMHAESAVEIYEGTDLGLTYTPDGSVFKVWAPAAFAVSLVLYDAGGNEVRAQAEHGNKDRGAIYHMQRQDTGVWVVRLAGDLKGNYYMYRAVYPDGTIAEAVDPYATAVSANGTRTAILDLRDTDPVHWNSDVSPQLAHPADAVIYEVHVRDFSAHPSSGARDKGTYSAFIESGLQDKHGNTLGIDHLAELGVTHVHLLPVFDFRTVDELKRSSEEVDESYFTEYNWGYDPQNYNVPEGSYSSNPSEPGTRIREFKELVQGLHRRGIGVILDVVYNHTFSVESGPFEALAPGYFYRFDDYGRLSNGSGVGNEIATERPMVRKYIKDSLTYWATEYHIDGFRFDLMGLIDSVTMREIAEELRFNVNPELLLYGEPWTGGDSPLPDKTLKGVQRGKGYAVFNDHFRSAIKGDSDGWGRGFVTGEQGKEGEIATGIQGAIYDFADSPTETVNYTTAHDNLNLWDKLLTVQGLRDRARLLEMENGRLKKGGDTAEALALSDPYFHLEAGHVLDNETVRRSLLAAGLVLTSQGIPFLHAGDEMLRSKFGDHNSYRSGDIINAIRWENKARFLPVFQYYKGLIALRRSHPAFRLHGREEIERSLDILHCGGGLVSYVLKNQAGGDPWRNIVVIFNANPYPVTANLPETAEQWNVVVDHTAAGQDAFRLIEGRSAEVEGLSMMVLYDVYGEPAPRSKTVEVHYEREDSDYRGWNLWVWDTGIQDGQCDFRALEDGRAVARIEVSPETTSIGYILRLNDWEEKDREGDRFVDFLPEETFVKVRLVERGQRRGTPSAEHLEITS